MFRYLGRKYSYIDEYPEPKHNLIIEPFAGSASYAMRYPDKRVILCEMDKRVYDIWYYIINKATPKRIMRFPILEDGETLHDSKFSWMKPVEKDLMGFFIRTCSSTISRKPSKLKGYNKWNEKNRKQLSLDIQKVKHWKIINGSYITLKNYKNATWFIDPPYQGHGGKYYKNGNDGINYKELAEWCRNRNGQVIVCENEEAKWLPFRPLRKMYQNGKKHTEVVWIKLY